MKKTSNTYKINRAREIRLWVRDLIVPATVGAITLASNPQVQAWWDWKKDQMNQKFEAAKRGIKVAK